MKIAYSSIYVDDQEHALQFYTQTLGFTVHSHIPIGDDYWLTVISGTDREGTQLQLDPGGHPAVQPYRRALKADGIPITQFVVEDLEAEVERLQARGVHFTMEILDAGTTFIARFDDTCGNIIQLIQEK